MSTISNIAGKKNTLTRLVGEKVHDGRDEDQEALVWANMEFIDQQMVAKNVELSSPPVFILMSMAAHSYFKLFPDKTAADLEREFRERNFDSGLIAVPWRDDTNVSALICGGKASIQPLCFGYDKNVKEETNGVDYYVMYWCRPRRFVELELAEYADSPAENLRRLETAGVVILKEDLEASDIREAETKAEESSKEKAAKEEEKTELRKRTEILSSHDRDFLKKLADGSIRLHFHTICMEKAWKEARDANVEAKEVMIGMVGHGSIVTVLVMQDTEEIVCEFARFFDGETRYIPVSSIKFK